MGGVDPRKHGWGMADVRKESRGWSNKGDVIKWVPAVGN